MAGDSDIEPTRVVGSEFGCMRRWPDCETWLADVLAALEAQGARRASYAFREDEWDGMDYELPASLAPGRFYWLGESGRADEPPRNGRTL